MKIPIFPLNGAVIFPKKNLPLNIFEKRYVDMVDFSLSANRLIGMVQQKDSGELYDIGCYGKITVFNETPDKKYLINLEGVNCFKIIKEIKTKHEFRVCEIEIIDNFKTTDLLDDLKPRIFNSFKKYNRVKNINIDLQDFYKLKIDDLLKLIVMISPFDAKVKQMFLELKTNKELYDNVLTALEIELVSSQETTSIN
jgi:uncharacterized protein